MNKWYLRYVGPLYGFLLKPKGLKNFSAIRGTVSPTPCYRCAIGRRRLYAGYWRWGLLPTSCIRSGLFSYCRLTRVGELTVRKNHHPSFRHSTIKKLLITKINKNSLCHFAYRRDCYFLRKCSHLNWNKCTLVTFFFQVFAYTYHEGSCHPESKTWQVNTNREDIKWPRVESSYNLPKERREVSVAARREQLTRSVIYCFG